MIPSFSEILLELSKIEGVRIYKTAQAGEWGILKDNVYIMKVNEMDPSDDFLEFYCMTCS